MNWYYRTHQNADSATAWSCQVQLNTNGDPWMLTVWLLTSQTTPDDYCESLLVGFLTLTSGENGFSVEVALQSVRQNVTLHTV